MNVILKKPENELQLAAMVEWAANRLPDANFHNCWAFAFWNRQTRKIQGVCLFHNYREIDVEIVFCGEGDWARRDLVNQCFEYAFNQLKCHRVTALVRKDNGRSKKLVTQLGFKREGKLRRAAKDGSDVLVYGLLPHEYRFWRNKDVFQAPRPHVRGYAQGGVHHLH